MKIFALQTDIQKLCDQYVVREEEDVLLLTHFHWSKFFLPGFGYVTLSIFLIAMFALTGFWMPTSMLITVIPLVGWLVFAGTQLVNSFISYRYSYLLVTTQKVVIIRQQSFFRQAINPVPLDTIVSTDVSSQMFGLFRCGNLVINLTERTKYSSKQADLSFVPKVNTVAGIIENAMVLQKNHSGTDDEPPQEIIEDLQAKASKVKEADLMDARYRSRHASPDAGSKDDI